jgi:hypothetical protein
MERCALVSVNGGWNLAIGTQTTDGGWAPIDVPEACKTVFQEAAKDKCFADGALSTIAAHPVAWLARAPNKLRVTFDYFGAAPWYLYTANNQKFPYGAKMALGVIETVFCRIIVGLALCALFPRRRWLAIAAGIALPGAVAYPFLAVSVLVRARRAPPLATFTALLILVTALTHVVFFGAGRYGLVVLPFVTALAVLDLRRGPPSHVRRDSTSNPSLASA